MSNVSFSSSGPPETVLPDPDPELAALVESPDTDLTEVAARFPESPLAWAALGDAAVATGAPTITAYAYFRVGYHRGLDLLRKNGWKGSGFVRSEHQSNQGFLRCLEGLADAAAAIGETAEAERCRQFLDQLDPTRG